jgi:hypothetical protein
MLIQSVVMLIHGISMLKLCSVMLMCIYLLLLCTNTLDNARQYAVDCVIVHRYWLQTC